MQLGDNLGFAGLVLALLGIGITILWPTKRWIAYACFSIALVLCACWGLIAYRASKPVLQPTKALQVQPGSAGGNTPSQIADSRSVHKSLKPAAPPRVVVRAPVTQSNSSGCNQQVIGGNDNTNNCNEPPYVTASAQQQEQTGDPNAPWETVFEIQTSALTQTGNLRLKCSGPVLRAGISRINPMMISSGSNGPDPADPTTAIYELNPDTLTPGKVITIAVFSTGPVKVISGTIGPNEIHFQSGAISH